MPASLVLRPLLRPSPLVVLAAVSAVALGTASAPAPATSLVGDCTAGASWAANRGELANAVIKLINQHRASLGLHTLSVSPALTRSAVWKARHMATYRYMGHNDPAPPVARTVGERLAACGYSSSWGENIAEGYPTPATVVAGWLGSPGHRANIENPSYRVTGVGVAVASGGIPLWAQDFGTTPDSGSAPAGGSGTGTATNAIVLKNLRIAPHRPHAGGNLLARVGVFGAPSLKPLQHATVSCRGVAGGHSLAVVSHSFKEGVAACAWHLASTQLVTGWIVVSSGGHAATAAFRSYPA